MSMVKGPSGKLYGLKTNTFINFDDVRTVTIQSGNNFNLETFQTEKEVQEFFSKFYTFGRMRMQRRIAVGQKFQPGDILVNDLLLLECEFELPHSLMNKKWMCLRDYSGGLIKHLLTDEEAEFMKHQFTERN